MRLSLKSPFLNTALGLIAILAVSACGNNNNSNLQSGTANTPLPANTTRLQFIEQFPVLNSDQTLSRPLIQGVGTTPVGVLLGFLPDNTVSYCTITHITPGRVLTNAHCVESDSNPLDYYVLFYNQAGQQISTGVVDFRSVGSSQNADYAVLDIPSVAAAQWDTAGAQLNVLGGINAQPAQSVPVTIWSFDPINTQDANGNYIYSNLYQQYNQHAGMILNPKTCSGSRTIPQVYGYGGQSSQDGTAITAAQVNANIHVMLDGCTVNGGMNPVHGNSGSLMTIAGNFNLKVGVYHWGIGLSDPTVYGSYQYFGNANQWLTLQPYAGLEFYQVGTSIDQFAQFFY